MRLYGRARCHLERWSKGYAGNGIEVELLLQHMFFDPCSGLEFTVVGFGRLRPVASGYMLCCAFMYAFYTCCVIVAS